MPPNDFTRIDQTMVSRAFCFSRPRRDYQAKGPLQEERHKRHWLHLQPAALRIYRWHQWGGWRDTHYGFHGTGVRSST